MMNESQFQGILKVLSGIKERSPFYAKKFEGIDLNQIKSQEDFEFKGSLSSGATSGSRGGDCQDSFLIRDHRHAGYYPLYQAGCVRLGGNVQAVL